MTLASQIRNVAAEIAANAQKRAFHLQHELEEIEARKIEVEAKHHSASLAHKRLADFLPEIGGNYQCPRCWIDHEVWSDLTPMAGTQTEDFFRCQTCNFEFSLSI